MKIRTITTGVTLSEPNQDSKLLLAAECNLETKDVLNDFGLSVQDLRISTNRWEEYMGGLPVDVIADNAAAIEEICTSLDTDFVSIGYAGTAEGAKAIPGILAKTKVVSTSFFMGDHDSGINRENVHTAAKTIKAIEEQTPNGFGNFMFCAWANCHAWTPFYPVGYHEGRGSFSIGLENGDLAMKAFSESSNLDEAEELFRTLLTEEIEHVEEACKTAVDKIGVPFGGIDVSLNPSLHKEGSIGYAYEELGLGKFGEPGTLSITSMITRVLKDLPIKKCGYSGLMLPVCEDVGLAKRASEGLYSIQELLLYSAVCGCGLDTVPIPGDVSVDRLESLLLDVTSLAIRLNKPLSARLLPVPGGKAGDMARFDSEFLCDCAIFDL